jgi:hypothetical protein
MEFPVHLRCSAVVAIVDCPDQGQFIRFLSLKQAALQSIWVFQESLFGNAIAKQGKWILLAEAAEAGITLSSYPATPQLSQCPEIGRLPGILLGMVVSKPIPLHL